MWEGCLRLSTVLSPVQGPLGPNLRLEAGSVLRWEPGTEVIHIQWPKKGKQITITSTVASVFMSSRPIFSSLRETEGPEVIEQPEPTEPKAPVVHKPAAYMQDRPICKCGRAAADLADGICWRCRAAKNQKLKRFNEGPVRVFCQNCTCRIYKQGETLCSKCRESPVKRGVRPPKSHGWKDHKGSIPGPQLPQEQPKEVSPVTVAEEVGIDPRASDAYKEMCNTKIVQEPEKNLSVEETMYTMAPVLQIKSDEPKQQQIPTWAIDYLAATMRLPFPPAERLRVLEAFIQSLTMEASKDKESL